MKKIFIGFLAGIFFISGLMAAEQKGLPARGSSPHGRGPLRILPRVLILKSKDGGKAGVGAKRDVAAHDVTISTQKRSGGKKEGSAQCSSAELRASFVDEASACKVCGEALLKGFATEAFECGCVWHTSCFALKQQATKISGNLTADGRCHTCLANMHGVRAAAHAILTTREDGDPADGGEDDGVERSFFAFCDTCGQQTEFYTAAEGLSMSCSVCEPQTWV